MSWKDWIKRIEPKDIETKFGRFVDKDNKDITLICKTNGMYYGWVESNKVNSTGYITCFNLSVSISIVQELESEGLIFIESKN